MWPPSLCAVHCEREKLSDMKRRLIFWFVMLVLFVGVALGFSSIFLPASSTPKRMVVEIPPNATVRDIAERLGDQRVIRSRYAFMLMTRVLGESTSLKAGEYEMSPDMGLIEIIDKLSRGDALAHWLTIPEGYTVDQIAQTLSRSRMAEERRFLRLARGGEAALRPPVSISRESLEGYLFPDSYKLKTGASEKAIIAEMLKTFREKVIDGMANDIHRSDLPLDKIVILASLIEREARRPEDRPLISAVLRNRLRQRMRLQVDASVLYALGHHKTKVLLSDLETPSPYNTYRNVGLPPGPICNPGLSAIQAALHPAKVNYLYYVAKPDGAHIFSRTYAEHQQAIRRARALQRAAVPSG
jgi:UPF0755 protein